MKYLLDSVVWLWSVGLVDKINQTAHKILANGESEIYFSAASVWELTIKAKSGKLQLPSLPGKCIPESIERQGLRPLPITSSHALKVYDLELHHNDPFDRLIIAQAIAEDMVILTSDRAFANYPVKVIWCGK